MSTVTSDHCPIVLESNKGKEFVLKNFLGSRQLGLDFRDARNCLIVKQAWVKDSKTKLASPHFSYAQGFKPYRWPYWYATKNFMTEARGGTRISRMKGQSNNKYKNLNHLKRLYENWEIWKFWRGVIHIFLWKF